jgi:hypothetical protein
MYLRLHLKVLDIEEVQQLLMVMEQLETVGYWSDVRTG